MQLVTGKTCEYGTGTHLLDTLKRKYRHFDEMFSVAGTGSYQTQLSVQPATKHFVKMILFSEMSCQFEGAMSVMIVVMRFDNQYTIEYPDIKIIFPLSKSSYVYGAFSKTNWNFEKVLIESNKWSETTSLDCNTKRIYYNSSECGLSVIVFLGHSWAEVVFITPIRL